MPQAGNPHGRRRRSGLFLVSLASDRHDAKRQGVEPAQRVIEPQLGFAGHFHLDYGDGELDDDQKLRAAIVRSIRELRPEVVVCPDPTAIFFGRRPFHGAKR